MDATYRTLRAAADLSVFTVKALALTAGVNEQTARSVLSRNNGYFEKDTEPAGLPRQRGGQARAWKLRPERRDELENRLASIVSSLERREFSQLEVTTTGRLTLRSPSPSPELLTADELDKGLLMPEIELLPRLVQRLLVATEGLSGLTVRTGAGSLVRSYDGLVQAPIGSPPYVPAGPSVWEVGAGGDPRDKANRDILERTQHPRNVATRRTAFVFVTTRRLSDWTGGEYADDWRRVMVIDADALEAWMLSQPAVHIWASELVGLKPLEVSTIERWYDGWLQQSTHRLPAGLLALGREKEADQLREAALNAGTDVGVYANSREEARAFSVCALLGGTGLPVRDDYLLRSALLVETRNEWARLVANLRSGILVPNFDDADVAAATVRGLTVLVPMGLGDPMRRSSIQLPRIERLRAVELLVKESEHNGSIDGNPSVGGAMSFAQAEQLAREIDQSLISFRRRHSRNRASRKAPWANDMDTATMLAPLVLLGSWESAFAGDRNVVTELARRDYEDLESRLKRLTDEEDPPFFQSGGAWRLSSPEDAFDQLGQSLTDSAKQRWQGLAEAVLGECDPVLVMEMAEEVADDLPDRLTHSSSLRDGIARGAALLGTFGSGSRPVPNVTVRSLIRRLLEPPDALRWCSAAPMLPMLAEADPDAFLCATNKALGAPGKPLLTMFRDGPSPRYGGTSPHVHLLWALEMLCRSPEHAAPACHALAALVELDPSTQSRNRSGNRPAESLRRVLLPWSPQINAALDERAEIVKGILNERPEIGWNLLISLLPQLHDWTHPTPEPKFRDWTLVTEGPAEQIGGWQSLVALAIDKAVDDTGRLQDLVQRLPVLNAQDRRAIVEALASVDIDAHDAHARAVAWQALYKEVARHREFPDAVWRLPDDVLEGLEAVIATWTPTDIVARTSMLFHRYPTLPLPDPFMDHEAYEREVEARRNASFAELWNAEGSAGVERLALAAPEADTIGWAAASVLGDQIRPVILGWLSKDAALVQVTTGWIGRMAWERNSDWVVDLLRDVRMLVDPARLAAYRALQDRAEAIGCVLEESPALQQSYWEAADMRMRWNPNLEMVVRSLIAHRRTRLAITMLTVKLGQGKPIDTDLVKATLEAALLFDADEMRDAMVGYELGMLLDFLEETGLDRDELARLEFSYIFVLDLDRRPRALFAALAERPELFVELVGHLVGRGTHDAEQTGRLMAVARAHASYKALREWRTLPGSSAGGIELDVLGAWVTNARELFAQQGSPDLGDEFIGQMLSGAPDGVDGIWPCDAVREILRQVGSDHLRAGLATGRFNARGFTTRGPLDGGQQERGLSDQYGKSARRLAARWPETSRLLRELADSYTELALQQDRITERFRDGQ